MLTFRIPDDQNGDSSVQKNKNKNNKKLGNVKAHIYTEKKKKKSVFATAHLGYLVFMVVVGIVSLTPPCGREGPYGSERQFLLLPTS